MTVFEYHFSKTEYYSVKIVADSLEEAMENLEYAGPEMAGMESDNSNFLIDNGIFSEEEDYNNEEQWEVLP